MVANGIILYFQEEGYTMLHTYTLYIDTWAYISYWLYVETVETI